MLVLSSPSGAGKTAIARHLLEKDEQLTLSVSVTTRPMRNGETDGVDYSFVDAATFARMVADDALLEHATVFNNSYGTPRGPVEDGLASGRAAPGGTPKKRSPSDKIPTTKRTLDNRRYNWKSMVIPSL